jgi:hypothetical protein
MKMTLFLSWDPLSQGNIRQQLVQNLGSMTIRYPAVAGTATRGPCLKVAAWLPRGRSLDTVTNTLRLASGAVPTPKKTFFFFSAGD